MIDPLLADLALAISFLALVMGVVFAMAWLDPTRVASPRQVPAAVRNRKA